MGLTAALTGLLTALVPVVFSLIHDGLPAPLTAAGLALGCVAIWLITRSPTAKDAGAPPLALLLGALSGVGFGAQLILFKMANGEGILWAMTSARAAGVLAMLLVLVARPPQGAWRGFWLTGIVAGMLDTFGNLVYFRATQLGRLDVAAVVCSLYPAGTILLAALVLREWPTRRQVAGMGLALAAVTLLSLCQGTGFLFVVSGFTARTASACDLTDSGFRRQAQSIFGIHVDFSGVVKGGFYFHPTDENLSAGTPERKKPLDLVLSAYTNSER
jgi:drug/metabolite transporter (DMT)-like permease